MKKSKKTKNTDITFETRRAAFREAKRDHGVPMGKHPDDVVKPHTSEGAAYELDERNRRLYIFRFFLNLFGVGRDEKKVYIREDKEVFYSEDSRQMDHFNAGHKRDKLKRHYYFKRK